MRSGLKIGISFYLDDSFYDIWANGAVQNIIFMYQLFQRIESVDNVCLAFGGNRKSPPKGLMLDSINIDFVPLEQAVEEIDVLIEMGLCITPEQAEKIHQRGGKTVSMRVGNDFIMDIESFIFEQPPARIFNGTKFDAVWTIPQYQDNCRSYYGIMHRAPVFVLPHLWSSLFVDKVIKRLEDLGVHFGYQPASGAKRISIFEPNISVTKTCYIPILLCEQAYRLKPELIRHVYACCTYDKREHPAFYNFIGRTDIVRENIMSVEKRFQLPDFMARYTDIVVSHQWENALNYTYYEALYGGYPLIHNSKLLPLGYYYTEFDASQGANVLLEVIECHDRYSHVYKERANDFIDRLSPFRIENIRAYEQAIKNLFL